ncbi:ribonuclease 3 [Striga asiatica]|uniref:Ribonuclease 3 n=1 Tax=Striga asiatica TaxID=4170 RepID=A0A5A7PIZ3_STRAF|nr:ribonuclease 3 [Striga asiatica]
MVLGSETARDLPISSLSHEGQSRNLSKQTRSRAINQANQEEQKHSTIKAHHQIQTHPILGIKSPLQKIRKNQEHIKDYSLHRVEPHIPAEVGIPHDHEVKSEEDQKAIQGKALEDFNGGEQWLNEGLERRELSDNVFPVLYAVEEGVEVSDGRD